MTKKTKIELYNHYWKLCLAAQRLVLIKKVLGIPTDGYFAEMEFIEKTFVDIKVDKEGEFEQSCGFVTVAGYKDEEGRQVVDFYFDLAAS